jgi:flagellar motility protein MotE (MotC chaperone)
MIRLVRELRLIPVVLFATVCLLALKVLGIVVDGSYTLGEFDYRPGASDLLDKNKSLADRAARSEGTSARAKTSWAAEMFNFPDVTGSIGADKPVAKSAEKSPPKPVASPPETVPAKGLPLDAPPVPPGERAMLERLQERRLELDARARELEIRENLLKTAEKQLELKIGELKDAEARAKGAAAQKDEAEAAKFKNLVGMYESMKAKDAAKILDRIELRVLIDVATQINPRRMSDILAQMQPQTAEKLTVELARRATNTDRGSPDDLPKIEGRAKLQ